MRSSEAPRLAFAVALGLVSSLAWSGPAGAATLTVTDMGDDGSAGQLRTLMNAAAPGDTIVIPAGTITVTGPSGEDLNAGGDLDVRKNLTIKGAGAGATIVDGGAIDGVFDVLNPNRLTLSGVTIRNGAREANVGSPQAGGGGIRNFGTLELARAVVSGNQAFGRNAGDFHFGGGIRNLGTLTVTEVTIVGNHARGGGGGVYNELGAVMTLTDVTVSGNTVEINGAGISNLGTATLTNVTVSGNNADQNGGGIFNAGAVVSAATATLTNVTVSGNNAVGFGGGMYNSATATLTNVTVSGNSTDAAARGGGILNFGSAALKNVLLGGNSEGAAGDQNCSGAITSLGHNLDSGTTCGLAATGDLSGTAPNLGPLQDNGGLTFTQALPGGSPAIDAGTNDGCPLTDQRGAPRPQGPSCDIGAYELGSGMMITPPGATVPPRSIVSFDALGGSGSGFTWSLATNASGGSIDTTTGVYTAGTTGDVTDVVQVTDSLGASATANVVVTAGVSISPTTASVAPRASLTFSAAGGSGAGFTWALATNASGGSIDATTGAYTAGPTGDVTDVVQATDSLGNTATIDVVVTAGVSNPPATASAAGGCDCGTGSQPSLAAGLALVALLGGRRRSNRATGEAGSR